MPRAIYHLKWGHIYIYGVRNFYGTLSLESNRGLIFIVFCTHSQLESRHDLGSIVEMRNLLRIIHIVLLLIFLLRNMMRCSIVH